MPQNLILHSNESQMIFKNEKDPSQVFLFDLETGKIAQKIKSGKDIVNFHQIQNQRKNGQRDVDQTLLGIDRTGVFKIDPRVKDSLVESKIYKT